MFGISCALCSLWINNSFIPKPGELVGGVGGSWSKAGVGTSTGNVFQEGQEAAVGSGKGSGLLFSDLMLVVRPGKCQIGR